MVGLVFEAVDLLTVLMTSPFFSSNETPLRQFLALQDDEARQFGGGRRGLVILYITRRVAAEFTKSSTSSSEEARR